MLKRVFDFFVFTSLFIAVCALLMVYQVELLFGTPLSFSLLGFVCCGTVCSYNFHWYLTPPQEQQASPKLIWNASNKHVHLFLFGIALAGAAFFAFRLLPHWFWLGITAFFTFLYSAPKINHPLFSQLKKVAVGKTIFLAFAWMHVTSLLPMVITNTALNDAQVAYIVNRFFFIYAICILFDYRDVEEDRKAGIRSMITYLDERGVALLFWGSVLVVFVTGGWLLYSFDPVVVAALLFPTVLLCLLYQRAKQSFSDYLYYFVLDGLMMLSAPLLLLIKFAR